MWLANLSALNRHSLRKVEKDASEADAQLTQLAETQFKALAELDTEIRNDPTFSRSVRASSSPAYMTNANTAPVTIAMSASTANRPRGPRYPALL